MAEGEKGGGERDPFEDLDQFFAPIEDDSEELASAPTEPTSEPEDPGELTEEEAAEALDGLEVEIDLPDELIEGLPEVEADAEALDDVAEVVVEDEPDAPIETTSELEVEEGEWDRLRAETLGGDQPVVPSSEAEDQRLIEETPIGEIGSSLEGYPGLAGESLEGVEVESEEVAAAEEEFADVGAVAEGGDLPATEAEAAAEHFASGMREADDLERELLSDLDESTGSETVRIEPPEPVAEAPTWQEGGQSVMTEEPPPPDRPGVGRNVPAALVSGVLLGAAVLALLAVNKGAFVVLATAAILLAQAELYAVMRTRGLQPATLLGLVCGAFTFVGAYLHGEPAILLGLALGVGLTVPWYVAAPLPARKHTTANAAATLLGLVYVPFMTSFAMLLLRTPDDVGRNLFLAMLVLTVLYDVTAYAIGSIWGHRPLAPTVSPNKSWEGALGATFIVLLVALAVVPNFTPFNIEGVGPGPAVGLALVIAIVAPLGDLVESAFKRDLGVKDMGSLLPGHGGMLDRIDGVLFAAPAAYFLLRIVLS